MNENKGKNPKTFIKRLLTGVLAFALILTGLPMEGLKNESVKAAAGSEITLTFDVDNNCESMIDGDFSAVTVTGTSIYL